MKLVKLSDSLTHFGFILIAITVTFSTILGLLAALIGGPFTRLGNGLGGFWGMPGLLLNLALLLGVPAVISWGRDLWHRNKGGPFRLIAFIGPLLIGFGYIIIAHAIDPCSNGLWNTQSFWGSVPLCERFGVEINIHTRFHLLLHAMPTLILVTLYWYALKRWYPIVTTLR